MAQIIDPIGDRLILISHMCVWLVYADMKVIALRECFDRNYNQKNNINCRETHT